MNEDCNKQPTLEPSLCQRAKRFVSAGSLAIALTVATSCAAAPTSSTAAVPEGTGCTNIGDSLTSGVWYAEVLPTSTTSTLSVNVVCFFLADADRAAAEDGLEGGYAFHIRDTSQRVRSVPVCTNAKFALITIPGSVEWSVVSASRFLDQLASGKPTAEHPQVQRLSSVVIPKGGSCAAIVAQVYSP